MQACNGYLYKIRLFILEKILFSLQIIREGFFFFLFFAFYGYACLYTHMFFTLFIVTAKSCDQRCLVLHYNITLVLPLLYMYCIIVIIFTPYNAYCRDTCCTWTKRWWWLVLNVCYYVKTFSSLQIVHTHTRACTHTYTRTRLSIHTN